MANQQDHKQQETKKQFEIREFIIACDTGNCNLINKMLSTDPLLTNAKLPYNDLKLFAYNPSCAGIHYASRSGHFEIVKLLINKYNAKFKHILDHENWNCLHYSCFNGHFNITKYLYEQGMEYKTITKFEKKTPFQFAFHRKFFDIVDIIPKYNYFGEVKAFSNNDIKSILAKTEKKLLTNQIKHKNKNVNIMILNRYIVKKKVFESLINIICNQEIYVDGVIVIFKAIDTFLHKINKTTNHHFDSKILFCIYYNRQQRIKHTQKLKSLELNVIRSGSISGLHHILLLQNATNSTKILTSLCMHSKLMLIE
eukprot:23102_1